MQCCTWNQLVTFCVRIACSLAVHRLENLLYLQRSIIVPPELGYGKQGLLEIPPNATFELQVQVLSVK